MSMYVILFLIPTSIFSFSLYNSNVAYSRTSDNACGTQIISSSCRSRGRGLFRLYKDVNSFDAEIVSEDGDDDEYEWIPDRDKARMMKEAKWKRAEASADAFNKKSFNDSEDDDDSESQKFTRSKRFVYTEEEEELISVLGGKNPSNSSPKREMGFLGDSTLKEISMDYQVPICYLADVLCGWGVPPPIDPNTMLGDMITGEQAFAILEAIHTLDVGSLNDRYSNYDLESLCFEYDIELSDGFELALKEGWNLPFGVKTFLRVEQEEHLVAKLGKEFW